MRCPRPRGERPQILVTVPAGTLLGLGGEPAHLAGYGPIPDALARELARDGVWRRVLTDPESGAVLDVGRRQHDPPADLERFVRIRDAMCRFPGCRRQAAGCDLDHTVAYPEGETSAANLHALCRRHHRLKHEAGWQATALPGGRLAWTSPLGAAYTTDPPPPGGEACTQHARAQWAPVHLSPKACDPDGEWLADLALADALTDALAWADNPDAAAGWPDWVDGVEVTEAA